MEHKIFLGKYRVTPDEVALAAAEPSTVAVTATEQLATARIYRGEEMDSGRIVTVEVIPAGAFKPSVRTKLEAEANAAKQINHINIPALYDFGIENDQLVYVTEHFDGASAEEWVHEHGPMPTGAVLRIALQVIGAMGAASFHKISHHAINPANLILVPGQTPEGDWPLVKVLHFIGVAPTFVNGDMSVAAFDKSSHYASPEQLQGGTVDFRSEIYSLGATMWFLLTGAPPLIAPKGPLSMQPTTIGLAIDKLTGMSKRVKRLLAQMLSVDPAARPQDPLAFYRQIQDCVAQVDRRESMARRFGVPFASRSNVVALPSRRRVSPRMVALAAIIVAFVALTSVLLASYLRHQRVREGEASIGVPIGVPETNASAPAVASAPTVAPAPQPPQQTAAPSTTDENQPPPAPEKAPVVAENNSQPASTVAPAPAEAPKVAGNETKVPEEKPVAPEAKEPAVRSEPPKVAANESKVVEEQSNEPAPKKTTVRAESPKVVANEPKVVEEKSSEPERKEPAVRSESPKIAANEPRVVEEKSDEPAPKETNRKKVREEKPITEVANARSVTPEVRRAEPAAPAEGPEEVAPAPENKVPASTTTKKERAKKPKLAPEEETMARATSADGDEEVTPSQAPQLPQLPRGRTRAKFIGVTADGNWMFTLPNKKIVVVPPPPGG
ncbi:MAG TPA: protein kinase [Chthoniobacterales bacterium]|jgi:serine/threonine-protein kinase|nr:protein kinase [Chthoniobacterales bacterium]